MNTLLKSLVGFALALAVAVSPCRASADTETDLSTIIAILQDLEDMTSALHNEILDMSNLHDSTEWNVYDESLIDEASQARDHLRYLRNVILPDLVVKIESLLQIQQSAYNSTEGAWNVYNEDALTYLSGMNDVLEMELPMMSSSVGSLVNFARNIYGDAHIYLPSIYNTVDSYLPMIYDALQNMGGIDGGELASQISQGITGGMAAGIDDIIHAIQGINVSATLSDTEIEVSGLNDAMSTLRQGQQDLLSSLDDFKDKLLKDDGEQYLQPVLRWRNRFSHDSQEKTPWGITSDTFTCDGNFFEFMEGAAIAIMSQNETMNRTLLEMLRSYYKDNGEEDGTNVVKDAEDTIEGNRTELDSPIEPDTVERDGVFVDLDTRPNGFFDWYSGSPPETLTIELPAWVVELRGGSDGKINRDMTITIDLQGGPYNAMTTVRSFARFAWWLVFVVVAWRVFVLTWTGIWWLYKRYLELTNIT